MIEKKLPINWESISLGDIVSKKKGKKPKNTIDYPKNGYYPYILIHEMEGGAIRKYTDDKKVPFVRKDEVLLVWDGSIGKCSSGIEGAIGSTLVAIKPLGNIPAKFIEYFVTSKYNYIHKNSTGTGLQHINKNFFKDCIINLPPLAEQERIVNKLVNLFTRLEKIKAGLIKIPELLQSFRNQILTQAVTGKLTEEWREKNKVKWNESTIKNVSHKVFDGPFGSKLKTSDYTDSGVQVVRLENIKRMYFDTSKQSFISIEKFQDLKNNALKKDDIIFASFVGDEIRATLLPDLPTPVINKADCFCIRLDRDKINDNFCLYFLLSNKGHEQINRLAHGMTRPRINLSQLRSINLPLPSLKEQQQIVNRVNSLFVKADKIQGKYELLKSKIDELPQAILNKAFKGELVPQLESDGDASELLREIENLKAKIK